MSRLGLVSVHAVQGKEATGPASGGSSVWMIIELVRFSYKRDEKIYRHVLRSQTCPCLEGKLIKHAFALRLLKIDRMVLYSGDTFLGGYAALK